MIGHYIATNGATIATKSTWKAILIQVDDYNSGRDPATPIEIIGKTKFATHYSPVAAINLADYSITQTPDSDGLYMIDVDGIDFIQFNFTGSNVYYNVV